MSDTFLTHYMETISSSRRLMSEILSILRNQELNIDYFYRDALRSPPTPIVDHSRRNNNYRSNYSSYSRSNHSDGHPQSPSNDTPPPPPPPETPSPRNTPPGPQNRYSQQPRFLERRISQPRMPERFSNNFQQSGRTTTIADVFAAAIMSEMNNLTPVVVRPSEYQINNATETISFSSILENERRYDRCPISHEPFTENSTVTRIRHCGHYFEPVSLTTLFRNSVRCPVCRYDIRDYTTTDAPRNTNANTNTNTNTNTNAIGSANSHIEEDPTSSNELSPTNSNDSQLSVRIPYSALNGGSSMTNRNNRITHTSPMQISSLNLPRRIGNALRSGSRITYSLDLIPTNGSNARPTRPPGNNSLNT
uniref:Uncharacterized protein n=1 Tax=viral metagenome TaxID=1070528 RepID=A0A6C0JC91_9ZZZZ